MENIRYLLRKISLVRDKTAIRKSQEENFNVFTTLLQSDDEVCLHSRFISSILDCKGPHRLGDVFLQHFLEVVDSSFLYNLDSLEIIPSNSTWTEYKEIDILLIDRRLKNAVIIENKINASDSNHEDEGQIERYYRRLIEEDHIPAENIEVYYLRPKRGVPPSDDSVSKSGRFKELQEKVKPISYEYEISLWIQQCIKEVANSPFLRETLNQYLKLINVMTNNSDIQERLDVIDVISTSNDTLKSAKLLYDNFCHVKWHTIANFFNDLCAELDSRGYKVIERFSEETVTNIVFGGIQKRRESINILFSNSKGYELTIGSDFDDALYFGIYSDDNKGKLKEIRALTASNKSKIGDIHFEKGWEFWCYFDVPEEDEIYLWDFNNPGTFNLIRRENRLISIKKHVDSMEKVIRKLLR